MMDTVCDCLCALAEATDGGATVFAKASDRPPGEAQQLAWWPAGAVREPQRVTHVTVAPPRNRERLGVLGSRPTWMWGIEHGVNASGVAMGNETIYTTLDPRPFPDALTGMDLVRLALERGDTAPAAVAVVIELLERYGQGGSGHEHGRRPYWSSFLVADAREAFVVETSGRTWAVEAVQRTRAISNRTTIAAFDAAHRHPRQPVATLVDPRLRASEQVLAAEPVRVEALITHLRSHVGGDDGWTVCMHAGIEQTNAAMVAELPSSGSARAWCALGSPCRSVFVPIDVGEPLGDGPPWSAFARVPASFASEGRDELEALLPQLPTNAARWQAVREWLDGFG